jgi:hypothetical protein
MWKLSILQSSRASTLILNVVHDDCYGYIWSDTHQSQDQKFKDTSSPGARHPFWCLIEMLG